MSISDSFDVISDASASTFREVSGGASDVKRAIDKGGSLSRYLVYGSLSFIVVFVGVQYIARTYFVR